MCLYKNTIYTNSLPVYEFDIWVTLHQHKVAPVPQQRCEGWVGDATLDGAVPAIVPSNVQVFGDGPNPRKWWTSQLSTRMLRVIL